MPDPTTPSRLPRRFRTVLHGTCLVAGNHPPRSPLARECPVARAERRTEARRRGWLTRKEQTGTSAQPDTGKRL